MKIKNHAAVLEDSETEIRPLYFFISAAELILGLFLVIYPVYGSEILTVIVGAVFAGIGIFNIASYFIRRKSTFSEGILSGAVLSALGLAFIKQADTVVNVTIIILGVFIVFEGLTCCRRSMTLKTLDFGYWYIFLIIAVIACVLGGVILIFPEAFGIFKENADKAKMIFTGILFMIEAALGTVSVLLIINRRRKLEKEIEEDKKIKRT